MNKNKRTPGQIAIGFTDPNQAKIEERRSVFEVQIKRINESRNILDADQLELFIIHWGAYNPGGNKMAWEKARDKGVFDPVGRLRTWAIIDRVNEKKLEIRKAAAPPFPDYYSPKVDRVLQGNDVMKYHRHLLKLGWKKNVGMGGTTWSPPKNGKL